MSAQKTILDRIQTVLEDVSGVNLVTQDMDAWNQSDPNQYNTVFISAKKISADVYAYRHPTAYDMTATIEITIEGNVYTMYSDDIADILDTMMVNIEKAIAADTVLHGLVVDIYLNNDEFISSTKDKYGLFSGVYTAEYLYNHLAP